MLCFTTQCLETHMLMETAVTTLIHPDKSVTLCYYCLVSRAFDHQILCRNMCPVMLQYLVNYLETFYIKGNE